MDNKLSIQYRIPSENSDRQAYLLRRARLELSENIYETLLKMGGMGTVSIFEGTALEDYPPMEVGTLEAKIYAVETVPMRIYETPDVLLFPVKNITWKEIWKIVWNKLISHKR